LRTLIDALNAAPGERVFVTAWVDEDEHEDVTFAEFRRRARAQAAQLMAHGVQSGDRVIVLMPQGIPAMTVFVGAMMLGGVPAILAYPNFKVEAAKYRSGLAGVTANLSAKLVVIDNEFPEELLGHVALGERSAVVRLNAESDRDVDLPELRIGPESLAFIQHSAGTTGLQKGVALAHGAVLTQLAHLAEALQIDDRKDRVYSWLPLYHDMGLIACFMLPMVCHIPVVMQSPLEWVMHPETMLRAITDYRCTLAWLPNFAFQFTPRRTRRERWANCDLSSVRALINCSEPVRTSSLQEFENAFAAIGVRKGALHSSYAMAENVFAVTQSEVRVGTGPRKIWADAARLRRGKIIVEVDQSPNAVSFISSGRLLPNHQLRIVSDSGQVLAEGRVGEILIQSDCLFQGYYNRPDFTAAVLADGWYHTGDLGFQLDGELYVMGRKKDLLIVGGENLYPQDIEEIAASHPDIHDGRVVAMGIYNPELGTEDVVIVAELEDEARLGRSAEIEREIRSRVVSGLGVAVRTIILKPPKWIVKSTAGKPARSSTREKLLREHPELKMESQESQFA